MRLSKVAVTSAVPSATIFFRSANMGTYEITFIVNHCKSVVQIRAASAGAAASLLRAQYRGCDVNISNISEIR